MLTVPETFVDEGIGQILLGREMDGIVVRILVAVVITQVFHQLRGGIADGQRHGLVAGATDELEGGIDTEIGAVALGRGGQIDRCLGQGDAPLRPADLHHGIEGGVGEQKGIGICQADVLGSADDKSAGDELRVFPTLDHTCKPVEGGIGIGTPNALDEGGDDVVVHLALLVVGQGILLEALDNEGVGDDNFI